MTYVPPNKKTVAQMSQAERDYNEAMALREAQRLWDRVQGSEDFKRMVALEFARLGSPKRSDGGAE